jgi:hypothetical protein
MMSDKRKYIRHPAEIPLEYKIAEDQQAHSELTTNVSFCGLCFRASDAIDRGTIISLKFPSVNSGVVLTAKVVWYIEKENYVDIGVEFQNKTDALMAKTLEEICYIRKFEKNHPQNTFDL